MGDSKNPEVWKAVAMADHFEKIQRLPDKLEGAPNFRRVPGYKVGDLSISYCIRHNKTLHIQREALGLTQGFVTSSVGSYTG